MPLLKNDLCLIFFFNNKENNEKNTRSIVPSIFWRAIRVEQIIIKEMAKVWDI